MGLLDSLLGQVGQVFGNSAQNQGGGALSGLLGPLAGTLGGLLSNDGGHGGLGGLVSKFQQAGLGDVVNSWVGNGQNEPVSPDQVSQALGPDTVTQLAGQLGINAQSLLPLLASALPAVVNKLTPNGEVPAQGAGAQSDLLNTLTHFLQQPHS
ncbi:MAG: YidB family protein [Burkholderiaceae bacterium]|jgi:uncharacterized protein YidB (DUF937 family)|nr:YidB family protein [Burkholderiaceae bacterium]